MSSPQEPAATRPELAGQPAPAAMLVNLPRLITAYYTRRPDPAAPGQRVGFGTSGHRGNAFEASFNEWHVLAVTQAICDYRKRQGIDGPLFLGIDTHALSEPAAATALEVLAGNGIEVMCAEREEYTPTPAISHAILTHNRGREQGLADGIVVTPSHNPPESGGFKYNPPSGGPAGSEVTSWIEARANELLESKHSGLARIPFEDAVRAPTTHRYDYIGRYVSDLGNVIDMDAIRAAKLRIGADPLGGAGLRYWHRIAEQYGLDLEVVSDDLDATFRFMTLDWDGRIRMDPSSPHAMQRLLALKERYDLAVACDPDYDRHGIVTPAGLMPSNDFLVVSIDYLFCQRSDWGAQAAVGKTVVSSSLIDRVAAGLERRLHEVPVGFKWFVDGLLDGSLGFGGEESAGASFLRRDGSVWCTDKDGIIACLLAAELTARTGRNPAERYDELTRLHGRPHYRRVDAPATAAEKTLLKTLSPEQIHSDELAGERIEAILTSAPGNGAPIGGVKVVAGEGWFAARPSGTEELYKIYAESFRDGAHLARIVEEAQAVVARAVRS